MTAIAQKSRKYNRSIFRASYSRATRTHIIEPHPYRNAFQRDRDRILYSKEFRRLSGKTQVFVAGFDDHMRTRLTHTLEVAQLADTISRALRLDDILTEAIAYGHDVGHTPFGHVGERTLNFIMNGCTEYYGYNHAKKMGANSKGFKHNLQSIRVVTELENPYKNNSGLNLTRYTLWGIKNHTKTYYKEKDCEYYQDGKCRYKNFGTGCVCTNGQLSVDFYNNVIVVDNNSQELLVDDRDWTFEALVVAYADEIAQRHHDIEDGLFAGIIDIKDLLVNIEKNFSYKLSEAEIQKLQKFRSSQKVRDVLPDISRILINLYTTHYINEMRLLFKNLVTEFKIKGNRNFQELHGDIYHYLTSDNPKINNNIIGEEFIRADDSFKEYLKNIILHSELAQRMDGKATYIIRQLIKAYLTNPQQLPDSTMVSIWRNYLSISGAKMINEFDKTSIELLSSNARNGVAKALKENVEDTDDKNSVIKQVLLRKACDHIAGMTDNFAYMQYESLYGTNPHKRNSM